MHVSWTGLRLPLLLLRWRPQVRKWGTGGPGYNINAEFNARKHEFGSQCRPPTRPRAHFYKRKGGGNRLSSLELTQNAAARRALDGSFQRPQLCWFAVLRLPWPPGGELFPIRLIQAQRPGARLHARPGSHLRTPPRASTTSTRPSAR